MPTEDVNISITTGSEQLPGVLARPDGDGPWPGVIVVHDILGVTNDLHDQLEWLAAEGFLALAPDLFAHGHRPKCLYETFRDLRRRSGPTFTRIDAARIALLGREDCNAAVAILGFCLGGDFALLLAGTQSYRVASVNYGGVPADAANVLAHACPIVGSFGAKDRRLRGAADRLEKVLADAAIEHDVKEYPDAGHAFMNSAGRVVSLLLRPTSTGLRPAAAQDARARIISFLRQQTS